MSHITGVPSSEDHNHGRGRRIDNAKLLDLTHSWNGAADANIDHVLLRGGLDRGHCGTRSVEKAGENGAGDNNDGFRTGGETRAAARRSLARRDIDVLRFRRSRFDAR
jgi:hypothetical protein